MARPTKYPEWASVPTSDPVYGGTNIVEPPAIRKQTGWLKEFPDAQAQNWFMNLVYQWILHFDEGIAKQQLFLAIKIATPSGQDPSFDYYTIDTGGAYGAAYNSSSVINIRFDTINVKKAKANIDNLGWVEIRGNSGGEVFAGGEFNIASYFLLSYYFTTIDELRLSLNRFASDTQMNAGLSEVLLVNPFHLSRVIQQNKFLNIIVSGTVNTYTATTTPSFDTLVDGMIFPLYFVCDTNAGASTLNINGTGAKPLHTSKGGDAPAEYFRNGRFHWVRYRQAPDDDYINLAPDRATEVETQGDTNDSHYVTPFSLAARTATTGRTGLVKKATTTEVRNEDADKYPDAASLEYSPLMPKAIASANGVLASLALLYGKNIDSVDHLDSGYIRFNAAAGVIIYDAIPILSSAHITNGKSTTQQIGARGSTSWAVYTSQTDQGNTNVDCNFVTIAVHGFRDI